MKLIEEFMVLANVAAAEALEHKRTPLIYRVHDTPSKEKLFAFSDFLRTLNITFAKGQVVQPGTFNRILAGAKGSPHEAVMNDVCCGRRRRRSMIGQHWSLRPESGEVCPTSPRPSAVMPI